MVDGQGFVELAPVAASFAGVVADPAGDGGQGVDLYQPFPGGAVVFLGHQRQVVADRFAGGAGVLAGGGSGLVDRLFCAPVAGVKLQRGAPST